MARVAGDRSRQAWLLSLGLVLLAVVAVAASADDDDDDDDGRKSQKAQHGGEIAGVITRCGDALGRAIVHIPGRSFVARTDAGGAFRLSHVPPGSHRLVIERGDAVLTSVPDVSVVKNRIHDVGAVDFCPDADNDGFDESLDCDDGNPAISPSADEFCDGVDNDCDGEVDEACPVCTDADQDTYFAQAGCLTAVDCDDQDPSVNPQALEECLDGIDNDCNGEVDEGCNACNVGESCDTGSAGVCQAGTLDESCNCTPIQEASDEVCNGQDDDCNGSVDDGAAGVGDRCGTGQCAGFQSCADGALVCAGGGEPTFDVCDGVDNDCDGQVDEGCESCDVGRSCATGEMGQCASGFLNEACECQPNSDPEDEICNGLDDDCDGTVDNDTVDTGFACGAGQCTGVRSCVDGALVCQGGRSPSAEVCDGIDNNCNGVIDEDCS